jgi:hypothetical protein
MWTKVATLCSVPPMQDLFPPMAKATALISERGNRIEGGLGMTQQGKKHTRLFKLSLKGKGMDPSQTHGSGEDHALLGHFYEHHEIRVQEIDSTFLKLMELPHVLIVDGIET